MKLKKSINLLVALSMSASSVFMTQNSYATIDGTGTDKLNPPVVDKKLNPPTVDEQTAKDILDKASNQKLDNETVIQEMMKAYLQDPSLAPQRAKMFSVNIDTLQRMIELQKSHLNKALEDYQTKYGKSDRDAKEIFEASFTVAIITGLLAYPLGRLKSSVTKNAAQGIKNKNIEDKLNSTTHASKNLEVPSKKVIRKAFLSESEILVLRNTNALLLVFSVLGIALNQVLFPTTEEQSLSLKQIKIMKVSLDMYSQQLSQLTQMNNQILQMANIQKEQKQLDIKNNKN